MTSISWRHIVPLIAALLIGGCRDRFLATSYDESPPLAKENLILYTDLDRKVVVSMTMAGQGTDVVPTAAVDGGPDDGPLLSSPPRAGLMAIERKGESGIQYTMHRLDGSIAGDVLRVGTYPGELVEGSFVLSHDAAWYAMFVSWPDTGSAPAPIVHLRVGSLTEDITHFNRITDPEHEAILAPSFSPKGDRIAYADIWGDFFLELTTLDIGGGNRRTCLGELGSPDLKGSRIEWSPDGALVAIAGLGGEASISLVDRMAGDIDHLYTGAVKNPHGLCWSGDGTMIAFWGTTDAGPNEDIFTIDVKSRVVRNVTNTSDAREIAPQWSPDGRRIACVIAGDDGTTGTPAVYDLTLGTSRTYPGRTSGVYWAR